MVHASQLFAGVVTSLARVLCASEVLEELENDTGSLTDAEMKTVLQNSFPRWTGHTIDDTLGKIIAIRHLRATALKVASVSRAKSPKHFQCFCGSDNPADWYFDENQTPLFRACKSCVGDKFKHHAVSQVDNTVVVLRDETPSDFFGRDFRN